MQIGLRYHSVLLPTATYKFQNIVPFKATILIGKKFRALTNLNDQISFQSVLIGDGRVVGGVQRDSKRRSAGIHGNQAKIERGLRLRANQS